MKPFRCPGVTAGLKSVSLGLSIFIWNFEKDVAVPGLVERERWVDGHLINIDTS